MQLLVRKGSSGVGVSFLACSASYVARGWIKSLTMVGDGPQEFSVHVGQEVLGSTTTGTFDSSMLTESGQALLRNHTSDDPLAHLADEGYMNLKWPARISIVTPEPPSRQHYFIIQEWAQTFQIREGCDGDSESDLLPFPQLAMYNLRTDDRSSTIMSTQPLLA